MHLEEQFLTTECSIFPCQRILRWIWELPWTAKFRIHLASCHNKWLGIFHPRRLGHSLDLFRMPRYKASTVLKPATAKSSLKMSLSILIDVKLKCLIVDCMASPFGKHLRLTPCTSWDLGLKKGIQMTSRLPVGVSVPDAWKWTRRTVLDEPTLVI